MRFRKTLSRDRTLRLLAHPIRVEERIERASGTVGLLWVNRWIGVKHLVAGVLLLADSSKLPFPSAAILTKHSQKEHP